MATRYEIHFRGADTNGLWVFQDWFIDEPEAAAQNLIEVQEQGYEAKMIVLDDSLPLSKDEKPSAPTVEFFCNSSDHAMTLERPRKMHLVSFSCSKEHADLVDATLPTLVTEWLYYPRELIQVLAEAGLEYRIHCHSGQVLTSAGVTP